MNKNPITEISRAIAEHQELKEALQATYENLDPQALADTLQGESNLEEALEKVAEQVKEYEALSEAIKIRIGDLQARKSRTDKAAETLRALILQAMDTAGLPKIQGTALTLAMSQRKGSVVIDDESEIPAEFFVTVDPKLDKKQVQAALEDGKPVSGAHMSNGSLSLTIRVK